MAQELFQRPEMLRRLTPQQVEQIVHLVRVHDDVENLSTRDELIMMEADTLGALDITRVTPTYDYPNAMRYMEELQRRRIPKFTTATGKQLLSELLPSFEAYVYALNAR